MALKALIFASSYKDYFDFINTYQLKRTECKCVQIIPDIQGYHKDTNPDLLLILLEDFWLIPVGRSNEFVYLSKEFHGQIYHAEIAEAAGRLIQLSYITKLELLPEYLSHANEKVREAAIKRQEELTEVIYDLP